MVDSLKLFAFRENQKLFRQQLNGPLLRLFDELTGLHLHIFWHHPLALVGRCEMPTLCPTAQQQTGADGQRHECCKPCLERSWNPDLFQAKQGARFDGLCGCTNFCACLVADGICHVTLVLQSPVAPCSFSPDKEPKPVSKDDFGRAVELACVILRHLESTAQARTAKSDLKNALRRLTDIETEVTYFRNKFHHTLPHLNLAGRNGLESRAQMHIDAVLDYVQQHCHHPMSLSEVAAAMKINASYLSALFTRTTGMTFHRFLQEIRLSRAKELLRDPRNRVSEVALAAGYTSPDAFRRAFKAREGHSPEAWRVGN